MDDVQEKARRNLVVFSTAILGAALLDVSIVSAALGFKVSNETAPWLFWLCVTAVLAYLTARFHWAPDVKSAKEKWRSNREAPAARRMLKMVTDELRSALTRDTPPHGLTILKIKVPVTHRVIGGGANSPVIQWSSPSAGTFTSMFSRSVSNTAQGTSWENPIEGSVSFSLDAKTRRAFQRQLFLARFRLDWPTLEYQFPWIIAGAAALTILVKLMLAYDVITQVSRFFA